jgi:hypothetical protein
MCIHVPGNLPRFIAPLNVPHLILNDVLLKKIFVGKLEYPVRQNQSSSAGFPILLFIFKKYFTESQAWKGRILVTKNTRFGKNSFYFPVITPLQTLYNSRWIRPASFAVLVLYTCDSAP